MNDISNPKVVLTWIGSVKTLLKRLENNSQPYNSTFGAKTYEALPKLL
ncbi:hypothetical protein N8307_09255 [Planktomarina temperata]|nr:hypothetical protein [Planktomarina temperata]